MALYLKLVYMQKSIAKYFLSEITESEFLLILNEREKYFTWIYCKNYFKLWANYLLSRLAPFAEPPFARGDMKFATRISPLLNLMFVKFIPLINKSLFIFFKSWYRGTKINRQKLNGKIEIASKIERQNVNRQILWQKYIVVEVVIACFVQYLKCGLFYNDKWVM